MHLLSCVHSSPKRPRRTENVPCFMRRDPRHARGDSNVCVCRACVSSPRSRSERLLYLFSADALSSGAVASAPADMSPSTLIPFYDPDTSLAVLTAKVGRGEGREGLN